MSAARSWGGDEMPAAMRLPSAMQLPHALSIEELDPLLDEFADGIDLFGSEWIDAIERFPMKTLETEEPPPAAGARGRRDRRCLSPMTGALVLSMPKAPADIQPKLPQLDFQPGEAAAIASQYCERMRRRFRELSPRMNPILLEDLPITRIKRIMKQDSCDPQPTMVSVGAVTAMAYVVQLFIGTATSLAWHLAQNAKRNTLQLRDLQGAFASMNNFDFLVDILDEFEHTQAHKARGGGVGGEECGAPQCAPLVLPALRPEKEPALPPPPPPTVIDDSRRDADWRRAMAAPYPPRRVHSLHEPLASMRSRVGLMAPQQGVRSISLP